MASGSYREKEHAFVTIERDIKEGNIPRLVLLCGKEEYLIRWYADLLVKKYVSDACRPIDLAVLEGESLTLDKIKESLETISLMSERKVVFLPDFLPAVGKSLKGFSETDVKGLAAYFDDIPQGSLLLMTAAEPKKVSSKSEEKKITGNKIRSAVEKCGKVYDFQPLKGTQLKGFIGKRFKNAGKTYAGSIIDLIISETGYGNKTVDYSLDNLENDLQKIIAHSGASGEVTAADVRGVVTTNPDNDVFAMLDAIGRNRKDEAFRLLHNLLETETPKPVFKLLTSIINQLELILSVKEMKDERLTFAAIQKTLRIHEFRLKKIMELTGHYSMEDLRNALQAAYEVDENIKTGLFEGQLALEYFIAKL